MLTQARTLHYAGIPGEGFGWGVCNANIRRHLSQFFGLVAEDCYPDFVFMPLADHEFNPISPARGWRNVAYTFFEFDLGPRAVENARNYDIVFCGSSWCLERMQRAGITNGKVLHQGVDFQTFQPAPRDPDGIVRVFSGGKFEWRKGQDLVIAAFALFAQSNPHSQLVCAWNNPWPALIRDMQYRPAACLMDAFNFNGSGLPSQERYFEQLLFRNGLQSNQFKVLPKLTQKELAHEMQQTDIGLFPNRCEGGTNLVLMEYLACDRPAIANLATGQRDLIGCKIKPIPYETDRQSGWARSTPEQIAKSLETWWAAHHGEHERIYHFSWQRAAEEIREALISLD